MSAERLTKKFGALIGPVAVIARLTGLATRQSSVSELI
jgi:hypothetical protein